MTTPHHRSRSITAAGIALLVVLVASGCGTGSSGTAVIAAAEPATASDPLAPFIHEGPYTAELRVTEDVGELTTSLVEVVYRGPEEWSVSYRSEDATGQRDGTRLVRTRGSWSWTQPSYNLSSVVTPEQQLEIDKVMTPEQWGPIVDQMIKDGRIPLTEQTLGSAEDLSASERTVPGDFALLSLFRPEDQRGFWLQNQLSVTATADGYTVSAEGIRMEFDHDGQPVRSVTVGSAARRRDVQVLSIKLHR